MANKILTSRIIPLQKTLTSTKMQALNNGSFEIIKNLLTSGGGSDSNGIHKINYSSIGNSNHSVNNSNSKNSTNNNNANSVNKTSNKIKCDEDDVMDFDTVAKAMIRRNYAIIDLARKGPQENKNVLAFQLKQQAYMDRDMQPRNYAPLKRPIRGAFLKNIY